MSKISTLKITSMLLIFVLLLFTAFQPIGINGESYNGIPGVISDSQGRPLCTTIHVFKLEGGNTSYLGNVDSEADGNFIIGKVYNSRYLSDGKYFLQAYPDNAAYDGFLAEYYFTVKNGNAVGGPLKLKCPAAQVAGRVVNPVTGELANQLWGMEVWKTAGNKNQYITMMHVYGNGKFSLGNLADGDYYIILLPEESIADKCENSKKFRFKITKGKYNGPELELVPTLKEGIKKTGPAAGKESKRPPVTFYVAANGSDSRGKGTLASPWKTIAKASAGMKAGDTCIIRGGTYRETLRPSGSGKAGAPITYKAYGGEKVVISGADPIGGFKPYKGNIYVTKLPWDLKYENQLLVNSDTMWEARWPNLPSFTMEGFRDAMAKVDEGTKVSLADKDLTQTDGYWNGATLWCRGGGYWGGRDAWLCQTTVIKSFSKAGNKLGFDPFYHSYYAADPFANNDYYLFGLMSLLDSPGEWYADSKAGKLYLIAPNVKSPSGIEMKKRMNAVDISGRDYITLEGLETLAGNVATANANHCVIDKMKMKWLNYSFNCPRAYDSQLDNGISLSGSFNEIKNSEIAFATGSSIKIDGSGNRIVNNYIHDIDFSGNCGSPVFLAGSRNLISNNTIKNAARFAISLGGGDTTRSYCENVIQYNDISDFMLLSSDAGAIYGFGVDGGNTRIHHNRIYAGGGNFSSKGIQLEGCSRNFIVDHNVIYSMDSVAIGLGFPQNYNFVYNNSLYDTFRNKEYGGTMPWSGHADPPYLYETNRVYYQNNLITEKVDEVKYDGSLTYDHNITDSAAGNYLDPVKGIFMLKPGSDAIDAGVAVPGITDGFRGAAPDIGAFEYGAPEWKAGCDMANPPNPKYVKPETKFMNRLANSGFEMFQSVFKNGKNNIEIIGWTKTGSKTATIAKVDAPSATTTWMIRGMDKKLALKGNNDGVEQTVAGLKPNTEYELAGWTYVEPGQTVVWGVKGYGGEELKITSSALKYRHDAVQFTTGPNNTSVTVYIIKTTAGSGFAYADDFGLVELP